MGAFPLHAYATRQSLNQSFSSIAADRNSESLTRTQVVPAQQVGFSVQWQHLWGPASTWWRDWKKSNAHGQTNEQGFFGGNPTSTSPAAGAK